MFHEEFHGLSPVNFFQFAIDCHQIDNPTLDKWRSMGKSTLAPFLLPDFSGIVSRQPAFARVWMAWSASGLFFYIEAQQPYLQASWENLQGGSSVELFVDTRDVKSAGFNTKFCHHFACLPLPVDGLAAKEITRFRTEDCHELCLSSELQGWGEAKRKGWCTAFFIPSHCLHGYDPEQCGRLGFTYKVNSGDKESQYYGVNGGEYAIEQQPSLWATHRLLR